MQTQHHSPPRLELIQIADAVAREKSIDKSTIIEALEEALGKIARMRYGQNLEIDVHIDANTGAFTVCHLLAVVADDEVDDSNQLALSTALSENPEAEIGTIIRRILPQLDFGRTGAQTAKQVIAQKVREAERENQYQEYKDRIGEIVYGLVKRVEYGNVVIDLGKGEGVVRREHVLPRESFRNGDRIRAYIREIDRESRGPQILLSRTDPEFMIKLFIQEVPEIYDGIITIKAVARDPGSRAKIAVVSRDTSIDPVGACVGMRGNRVQAVVNELHGEKIDIIPWAEEQSAFIVNALAPAEITKVVVDDENQSVDVVVPEDQLSLAIGRRGQNVRLASQLTGWKIEIMTEADESTRRQAEFTRRTELFEQSLDLDEMIAQLLASEGFESIEEIANVAPEEITAIEGFDIEIAEEIHNRAVDWIAAEQDLDREKCRQLGVDDPLLEHPLLTLKMVVSLAEGGVCSLENLADCDSDELIGWTQTLDSGEQTETGYLSPYDLDAETAAEIILHARRMLGVLPPEEEEETTPLDDAPQSEIEPNPSSNEPESVPSSL